MHLTPPDLWIKMDSIEGRNSSVTQWHDNTQLSMMDAAVRGNFSEKLEAVRELQTRDLTGQQTTHNPRRLCCPNYSPHGPHLSPHTTTAHPGEKWCQFHCRDDGATKKDRGRDVGSSVPASPQSQQCQLACGHFLPEHGCCVPTFTGCVFTKLYRVHTKHHGTHKEKEV